MKDEFIIDIIPNKSRTYMLPFLHKQVEFEFKDQILNTYLSVNEEGDMFCVMYDWNATVDFMKFEGKLMKNHLFEGHIDYGGKVVYMFRLSRHMQMGKELFIQGKYTEFSDDHKKSILDYLEDIGANNAMRIAQILSEKAELSSTPPIMENEVLVNHVRTLTFKSENLVDESN